MANASTKGRASLRTCQHINKRIIRVDCTINSFFRTLCDCREEMALVVVEGIELELAITQLFFCRQSRDDRVEFSDGDCGLFGQIFDDAKEVKIVEFVLKFG